MPNSNRYSKNRLSRKIVGVIGLTSISIYCLVLGILSYHYYRLEDVKYEMLSDQISLSIKPQIMVKDEIGIRAALDKVMEASQLEGVRFQTDDIGEISNLKSHDTQEMSSKLGFLTLLTRDILTFHRTYNIYPNSPETFKITFFYRNTSKQEVIISSLAMSIVLFLITIIAILSSRTSIDKEMLRRSVDEEKSKLASRIFHLVRSDLIQLHNLMGRYQDVIRREDRILVKSITGTILSASGRFIKTNKKSTDSFENRKNFKLSDLIEEIIARKKLEYPERADVQMVFYKDKSNEHIEVISDRTELQFAISNLVNNSFEAIKNAGEIRFDLFCEENLAVLTITDNGPGIEKHRIPNIVKGGYSYNKSSGNGFGISQAIEIVESLGGEMAIESDRGLGMKTVISLLSEAKTLERYTQEEISQFQYILVEDSKARRINFEKEAKEKKIPVGTFSGFVELKKYLIKYRFNPQVVVYTDSDLGEEHSGEDSARELYHSYGFTNIRLITAGDLDNLKNKKMEWISEIIGKHEQPCFFA